MERTYFLQSLKCSMLINLETEYKISMVSVNNTNVSDKGKLK